jgi:hypothetical protein
LVAGPEDAFASVHEKVRNGRLVDAVALDFALKALAGSPTSCGSECPCRSDATYGPVASVCGGRR